MSVRVCLAIVVLTATGISQETSNEQSVPGDATPLHVLILTGDQHPAHDWKKTTAALKTIFQTDKRFVVQVLDRPQELARHVHETDVIVQNYGPWSEPPPGSEFRSVLKTFVARGRGIVLIHYANGTFRDWLEYRGKIARRYWIDDTSGHDPYQEFEVVIRDPDHPITKDLNSFTTTDELYFRQGGAHPVDVLAVARSQVTGKDEPLVLAYKYHEGRVFQTLLGHDAAALRQPGTAQLIRRGTAWSAKRLTTDH